jgi:hypothetical protein
MAIATTKTVERVLKSLRTNRFNRVDFVEDADTANGLILDMIPIDATVGIGGSVTVMQIGLIHKLKKRGTMVVDYAEPSKLLFDDLLRQTLRNDFLLTSSNAVTLDGELVNIDGIGNRVAGMIFGPKKVILVIGMNKVVRNVEEAVYRIRNFIAPYHAMTKGKKTPCAIDGPALIVNLLTEYAMFLQ